jgi:hypothetical protein
VATIPVIDTPERAALAEQFETLASQWKAETALLSSTSAMVTHPAYRAIIALGPGVVPFFLRDLEREPAHWFEALKALTGEDPVSREQRGNIPAMAAAWLAWGRKRGLI